MIHVREVQWPMLRYEIVFHRGQFDCDEVGVPRVVELTPQEAAALYDDLGHVLAKGGSAAS